MPHEYAGTLATWPVAVPSASKAWSSDLPGGLYVAASRAAVFRRFVHHDVGGMRLDYAFPTHVALALVPTILTAALVAAICPAESAVHGSLVEALEYE